MIFLETKKLFFQGTNAWTFIQCTIKQQVFKKIMQLYTKLPKQKIPKNWICVIIFVQVIEHAGT